MMRPPSTHPETTPADPSALRPSKTRRKLAMHALQDLGARLVELPDARLAALALPENLLDAIRTARRIHAHEGRRRQMQYIGRLMRSIDADPIRIAIEELDGRSAAAVAALHRLEVWRERLLDDESVLGEIVREHPSADLQTLRTLRRNALKERELDKPPRAYRELFRVLKQLAGGEGRAAAAMEDAT
ncbi:MAG TPA: ribosome biogenesis factor YjgA [Rhodocyclaceae bacterium]|nr:ribosome biogenesis factor YjgA [Rhodocyclaceae bacterium]